MLSKIVKKSNLGLHLQLQKAEQEVAKAEARVESLRLSKNRATERLHAARGHFQILTARLDARIADLKADLTIQK
jgi:SMC interacting uncharacterized protein involved in chromosome segregation